MARHTSASRRRRRQGTASVEVIMMLPFFFIVFAGIYFMYGMYMARQHAMLRSRSCTWIFAAAGCPDDKRAELLECLKGPTTAEASATERPNEDTDPPTPEQQPKVGNGEGPEFLSKLADAPVIGAAIKWLFGVPVGTIARQPAKLAYNLTPQKQDIVTEGHYFTMCNTIAEDWGDVAMDVFCGVVGGGFPGC